MSLLSIEATSYFFLPLCFDRASHRLFRPAYCALFPAEASNSHEGAYDRYTQHHENRQQPALRRQSQEGRPHKLDALRQREKLHNVRNYRDVLESYGLEDDKAPQEADLSMCDADAPLR